MGVCLFGSYFFYGWWDWRFLGLILFLTLVNYYLGLKIEASLSKTKRKKYLAFSIVISVGVLATFKYANFFIDTFQDFIAFAGVGWYTETLRIILPLGSAFIHSKL